MRYSLLSRFQGALLGAALGEILGNHCQTRLQASLPLFNLMAGQWILESVPVTPIGWGSIAVDIADRLSRGAWEPKHQLELASAHSTQTSAGIAIAIIPIALFFHEDLEQLRDSLSSTIACWHDEPEVSGGVLAVSYAIALALQERLNPPQLINQLLTNLELSTHSPLLSDQLLQVQHCLEQRVGLAKTIARLHSIQNFKQIPAHLAADLNTFAIALYCFLSTPEDYGLALSRCVSRQPVPYQKLSNSLIATTALSGALSGVYNSCAGLPIDWQRLLKRAEDNSPLARLWSLSSKDKLEQLANQLLSAWSGVYQPLYTTQLPGSSRTIASPQVIRPR
jgi:ADP-ribosylglycohydrolase